jgi:hypothetical protein
MEKLKALIKAAKALKEDGYKIMWTFNEGNAFLGRKPICSRNITLDIHKRNPVSGEIKEILELIQSLDLEGETEEVCG